jgi:hypothetical protein
MTAMIVENTPQKLVLRQGSTTLDLDKGADRAAMQRKILFWTPKPREAALHDVADITLDIGKDVASGADLCSTMVVFASGSAWALPADSKQEAQSNAETIAKFLGLTVH